MAIVATMRAFAGPLIVLCLGAAPALAGETSCRIENGAVVVPAAFGDIAGDFLIDASRPTSVLHLTAAQGAGIVTSSTRGALRVAARRVANFPMEVASLDTREQGFVTNISGALGADFLRRFVVDLDFSPCRIDFVRQAKRHRHGAVRTAIVWVAGAPTIGAAIADREGTSLAGRFAIDTAAVGSRIADARFTRPLPSGADPASPARPPARLRALSVAGDLFEETPAGILPGAPPGLAGTIGLAVWTHYRMRLDLAAGWVELSPRPKPN